MKTIITKEQWEVLRDTIRDDMYREATPPKGKRLLEKLNDESRQRNWSYFELEFTPEEHELAVWMLYEVIYRMGLENNFPGLIEELERWFREVDPKEQKFEIVVQPEDLEELKALHKQVVDDSVAGMLGGGTPSKRDMFLMNILNQFVAQISE